MNRKTTACAAVLSAALATVSLQAQVWLSHFPAPNTGVVADSTRGRLLLQGGNFSWPLSSSEQCEWFDGQRFTAAQPVGAPAPPFAAIMAHDPLRGRTVWLGNAQTWEHDGAAWMQRNVSPPTEEGPMVWHPGLGRVLLVAGNSTMWTWDGLAWSPLVSPTMPPPRYSFGLAYDELRKRTVLFGGITSTLAFLDDTWEFDGVDWQQQTPAHPPTSGVATMAYDQVRQRVVARVIQPAQSETWEFDGTDWAAIPMVLNAAPWVSTRLCTSPVSGRCWQIETYLQVGDTCRVRELQGSSWVPLPGARQPPARYGLAAAVDQRRDVVWTFGGRYSQVPGSDLAAIWQRFGDTWVEQVTMPQPSARSFAGFVHDEARDRTVLFGGMQGSAQLGDTWELHAGQWTQRTGPSPSPRSGFGMVYDPLRARIVLFGGQGSTVLSDVWQLDANGWTTWPAAAGPGARTRHAMAYDAANDRIVVFGGHGASTSNLFGDTWALAPSGWTQIASTNAPSPRYGAAMAYDPFAGAVVLVGGKAGVTGSAEVWELHGSQWSLGAPLPDGLGTWHSAALVAVPARQSLELLHGAHAYTWIFGNSDGARPDVWTLETGAQPRASVHGTGCPGSAGVPALAPTPGSLPALGGTFSVQLTNAPTAPGVALIAFGTDIATFGGEPLPLSLAALGLPGCHLWIAPEVMTAVPVTGGVATWSFALPATPVLSGVTVGLQALVPDAGLASFGTLSNAVVGVAR